MPIIDRPRSTKISEEACPMDDMPKAREEAYSASLEEEIQTTGLTNPKKKLLIPAILALILGVALPFISYLLYSKFTGEDAIEQTAEQSKVDEIDISTDLDRLVKIGSLASLAKKEFEVNFISLQEAEKSGGSSIISALEIIVNKKRQELSQYKEKLIALLLELNKIYTSQPIATSKQFNKAIASAEGNDSIERVRLLKLGLKILEGAPKTEEDLMGYMKVAAEDGL